NQKLIANQF
nr:Chain C, Spike protein S2' [Severe acute respiratory syndrome coronavirus 2]